MWMVRLLLIRVEPWQVIRAAIVIAVIVVVSSCSLLYNPHCEALISAIAYFSVVPHMGFVSAITPCSALTYSEHVSMNSYPAVVLLCSKNKRILRTCLRCCGSVDCVALRSAIVCFLVAPNMGFASATMSCLVPAFICLVASMNSYSGAPSLQDQAHHCIKRLSSWILYNLLRVLKVLLLSR
jgi:hypothetical protein